METTPGKRLFALLIGIDTYPSGVPSLQGCVNDVNAIEQVLQETYGYLNPQIKKLTNKEATRTNIIAHFRNHLSRATSVDSVLIYYSGHGSRESSPEEFWREFPTRKNETLVCYDSRLEGGFDLADKELAVLLSEVAANKPHLVVCLDSCHSGSGTRESVELTAVRQVEQAGNRRTLASYLDGYYSDQLSNGGSLFVPVASHVLLAACQDDERAYETIEKQGLFTTALLACLAQQKQGGSTYAELYQRISINVRATQRSQHPNLEFLGGFDPHTLFLAGTAINRIRTFPVYFDATHKTWKVEKGSIDGLSVESVTPVTFWVFDSTATSYTKENSIAEAKVVAIQPKQSTIRLTTQLKPGQQYIGYQVDGGTKNASIYAEIAATDDLFALFEYQETTTKAEADYWLLVNQGTYQLIHRLSHKLITEDVDVKAINLALQQIARWENLKKLRNPKPKIRRESVQLQLTVYSDQGETVFQEDEVEIYLKQDENGEIEKRPYSIDVQNSSGKELHVKLLFISPLYGILQLGDAIVPNGQQGILVNYSRLGFFPEQVEDTESNAMFKLVASTEKIELSYFEQLNFSLNRATEIEVEIRGNAKFLGEMGGAASTSLDSLDWFTKDLRLRMVKASAKIGRDQVKIADGMVVIQPHSSLQATISLTEIFNAGRGADSKAAILQSATLRHNAALVSFNRASKSAGSSQLIELQDIEGTVSEKDPLIITIQQAAIQADELLLPVAVDGDNLLVIGSSQTLEPGKSEVYIERIPETEGVSTKNVGRALKFCLMKLVFKSNPDHYFQLRWVDFEAGKPMRRAEGIREKVKASTTILLLVHGIIGDTEGMLSFVKEVTQSNPDQTKPYDLALTFDYECLNTPIDQIASNLISALAEAGISDTTGKKVTIIAHSMGGLVSRIMIERLHKGVLVDKLIMAGTPNGGSNLGGLPAYVALASDVLTLGLSSAFVAPYLPWAAGLVVALKKSEHLTVTLAQMSRQSDFIRELKTANDPHIPYFILAGRIDTYINSGKSWFGKLITNLVLTVGNVFHKGELHDIAVYTTDIEAVDENRFPKPVKQEIGCPHVFYYDELESKAVMYEWLKK